MKATTLPLIVFLACFFLGIQQSAALSIELSTFSDDKVHPGEDIFVSINVAGLHQEFANDTQVDSLLAAFSVDVRYDPSLFLSLPVPFAGWGSRLGDVSLGEAVGIFDDSVAGIISLDFVSLLEESPSSCVFCIPPYLDHLQRSNPADPGSDYLSSFSLAILGFRTPATGTPGFGWPGTSTLFRTENVVLGDPDGFEIQLLDENGDPLGPASVNTPALTVRVPAPGVPALIGIAMLGLLVGRRDKHHRLRHDDPS